MINILFPSSIHPSSRHSTTGFVFPGRAQKPTHIYSSHVYRERAPLSLRIHYDLPTAFCHTLLILASYPVPVYHPHVCIVPCLSIFLIQLSITISYLLQLLVFN